MLFGVSIRFARLFTVVGVLLGPALVSPVALSAATGARVAFAAGEASLAARARQVPMGHALRVAGVPLGDEALATLVLERFAVFTPEARVVLQEADGERAVAPPERVYFRGEVVGDPASVAFLAIDEQGRVKGLVAHQGELRWIGGGASGRSAALESRRVDVAGEGFDQGFHCSAEELDGGLLESLAAPSALANVNAQAITPLYTADIAVETDYEFFQLFPNAHAAAGYIGDLMGAISAIFYRDVGVTLKVNHVSLWTSAADPWSQTGNPGLCEFGGWWNTNRPQATHPRATVQFLSGKNVGSGTAWLGVLCSGPVSGGPCGTNGGGAYSFISGIDGIFSLSNPSFYWDIAGTAHELGHNFNSPHTHCYNNIPSAGAPPVDHCRSGESSSCYSGAVSVPAGGGSLMSYCHLLGGYANVNLAFGQAGLYGTQSERVTARMRAHVQSRSCLAFTPARATDFNGDGRADPTVYRNGTWIEFPVWPGH